MQSPAEPKHPRPAVSRLSPARGVADRNESPYRGYRSPRAAIAASGVRSNQARARGLQGGCVCCGAAWDFAPTEEGRNPTLQGVVCRSRFATGGSKIATAHDPDRKHTHLQIAANRPDGCGAGGRAFARPTWGGGWGQLLCVVDDCKYRAALMSDGWRWWGWCRSGAACDTCTTEEGKYHTLQGVVCCRRLATAGSQIATAHNTVHEDTTHQTDCPITIRA